MGPLAVEGFATPPLNSDVALCLLFLTRSAHGSNETAKLSDLQGPGRGTPPGSKGRQILHYLSYEPVDKPQRCAPSQADEPPKAVLLSLRAAPCYSYWCDRTSLGHLHGS